MKSNRNLIIVLSISLLGLGLFNYFLSHTEEENTVQTINFSDFVNYTEDGKVTNVYIKGYNVKGQLSDGKIFKTYMPFQDDSIINRLLNNKVNIIVAPPRDGTPSLLDIFLAWFPTFLFIGVILYTSRMSLRGGMSKNKTKQAEEKHVVRFNDVAGLEESKEELIEIVDFLKEPKKYQKLGGQMPKGILLVGPPGNGKTLLARAIAGEANVPFFYMSGSGFVEMYVGVGAARVRELFKKATTQSPCIIFIDEIDAIGGKRSAQGDGGSKEFERTLNELLIAMDGFAPNSGVIVIAATNRADVLDAALMRRFERQIYVSLPDIKGREAIFKLLTKKMQIDDEVDFHVLAKRTVGASGSDLKTIINEAALLAVRANLTKIIQKNFEAAIDRVYLGMEKKSQIISQEDKLLTAYHESGHAIVAYYSPGADPIHKVTIIPRGNALGMVSLLPNEKVHMTLQQLKAKLKVASAGRVAEVIKYGAEFATTGASSDIQYATNIAMHMMTHWGFSKELGPVNYDMNNGNTAFTVSDKYKETILKEVKELLEWAQLEAKKTLTYHEDKFELLTQTLIEHETLTGEQVKALLETGELPIVEAEIVIEEDSVKKRKKKTTE